jgi:REP element-mobilizing transposase RayT
MLAAHVIFGAYGFWLPNDPRGSWSTFVGSWELFRYGAATKTVETRSLASRQHDAALRVAAKKSLARPAVMFDGVQARAIGRGFATYAERAGLKALACAILPNHVHLVLASHRLSPKQLVIQMKGEATGQLVAEGIHPFERLPRKNGRAPKCFAVGGWTVYLDTVEDVQRAVRYVEENPAKEGLRPQRWGFVTKYC